MKYHTIQLVLTRADKKVGKPYNAADGRLNVASPEFRGMGGRRGLEMDPVSSPV